MYKRSMKPATTVLVLALTACMSLWQGTATAASMYDQQSSQRSAGAMAVDAVVVRPLGLVATVIGSGLFVVSLPFSALGGNVDEAAQNLVVAPARFTFKRPLGQYDTRY
jgi:hypothetical protein